MKIKNMLLSALSVTALVLTTNAYSQTFSIDTTGSSIYWKGTKVGGSHDGNINFSKGELVWEGDQLKSGELTVDMDTMTNLDLKRESKKKDLIGHLKSDDFFAVSKYPTATIKFSKVEKISDGKYKVTGDFTVRGNTNPITFEANVRPEKDRLVADAELTFDRSKYDVKYNSGSFFDIKNLGDKLIHDDIQLKVDLLANKK